MATERSHQIIHRRWITVTVMLATIMEVVDLTIANVALPHIQGSLSASQDQAAWILTSYIVASAVMTPPAGWLSDQFGRRRVFLAGIAGFTVASLLVGSGNTLTQVVFARVLQGLFGAALIPLSQAILLDSFPREKHGLAMAIWGVGIMLGPIVGPALGGYITENLAWRWIFFINIPIGLLALVMTWVYVPESTLRSRKMDWFGFFALTLAIGALQLMLDRGERQDWFESTEIVLEAGLALSGLYLFLTHSIGRKHAFLDLRLFLDRNFSVGVGLMFAFGVVLMSAIALLPAFMQNLLDFPVLTSGLLIAPRGVGAMLSMIVVSSLIQRVDPRLPVLLGMSVIAFAFWEMSQFTLGVDPWAIIWTGFVQGLGLGQVFVPLSTIAFSTLPVQQRTEGSGVFNLLRNIGSSLGISVVFTQLTREIQINHAVLGEHLTPMAGALRWPQVAGTWDTATTKGLTHLNLELNRQAWMLGWVADMRLLMWVTLASLPLLLLLRRGRAAATVPMVG